MHIIGGKYKKKILQSPTQEEVRPTSSKLRETLFNICQDSILDAKFLDLFAGSGAVGLEALSRGASQAIFVERGRHVAKVIKANIEELKEEAHTEVIVADVFSTLQHLADKGLKFDIIFADPPYGLGLGEKVLSEVDRLNLLNEEGQLFIEDEESPEHLESHLQHLKVKSLRKAGRTWLRHYSL